MVFCVSLCVADGVRSFGAAVYSKIGDCAWALSPERWRVPSKEARRRPSYRSWPRRVRGRATLLGARGPGHSPAFLRKSTVQPRTEETSGSRPWVDARRRRKTLHEVEALLEEAWSRCPPIRTHCARHARPTKKFLRPCCRPQQRSAPPCRVPCPPRPSSRGRGRRRRRSCPCPRSCPLRRR